MDVIDCRSCGREHDSLVFQPLAYESKCPVSGDPISGIVDGGTLVASPKKVSDGPIGREHDPNWTVLCNLVSQEDGKWIGMSWEFFDSRDDAKACYERQRSAGNVPCLRRFKSTDRQRMGAVHR